VSESGELGEITGATGLFLFARRVWDEGNDKAAGSGSIVRWETSTIYAPRALIEFATEHPDIGTHDELIRMMREAKLNVWFAAALRYHRADGAYADMPVAYRYGESPENFRNERAVLLTLAGRPPGHAFWDCALANVEVIEDAMMELEPREGLRRLLGR
jgi:hypothetical protein